MSNAGTTLITIRRFPAVPIDCHALGSMMGDIHQSVDTDDLEEVVNPLILRFSDFL